MSAGDFGPRSISARITGRWRRRSRAGRGIEWVVAAEPALAFLSQTRGLRVAVDPELVPFRDAKLRPRRQRPRFALGRRPARRPGPIAPGSKPDGLFLAAMLGGGTLAELRTALVEAELAEEGGISPRVSPTADLADAAALLQRAGFALPVADADTITVTYPDMLALLRDLRGMGETNALAERRRTTLRCATLARAAVIYTKRFGDADGHIPATFEVLYLTGWAPDSSQPQPLKPGSAAHRLAAALGTTEISAGDPAAPPNSRGSGK